MPTNTENLELIDSHCHLDFAAFDNDRHQVLERCANFGVKNIIIPGVLAKTWQSVISLCDQPSLVKLHYALGLHPLFLTQHKFTDLDILEALLKDSNAIAIGEIGLDFYSKTLDKSKQINLFDAQLAIAQQHKLPVIIHSRKTHHMVIQRLKNTPVKGGIIHAFNGSIQEAEQYINLGFKLGFGGMLTYQRSRKLRNLAKTLPLSSLVIETDSPDMAVRQHYGERNSPEYLPFVLDSLTRIRNQRPEDLVDIIRCNISEVFQGIEL